MLIGITGNIGSGKTSIARRLGELLDAPVLSADEICRELMEPGNEGYDKFIQAEGSSYLDHTGRIDRKKLRHALFLDTRLKGVLESVLHPLVRDVVLEAGKNRRQKMFVVAEIPLLYESGWEDDFDLIVAVRAPVVSSIGRVVERDGGNEKDVLAILEAQISQDEKCQRADFSINNGGEWGETEKQILRLAEIVRRKIS